MFKSIFSKKLKGICDYLLEENGVQIPLKIKTGKCNANTPFKNDVMQLMCSILLLEENYLTNYKYGYILYVRSKKKYKVEVDAKLRSELYSYIRAIHSYMFNKKIPKRQENEVFCRKCSYRDYCWCE
ncbi:MAG: CRISPR-associated protein Cas4 [Promethearchaeota archaeon]